MLLTTTTAFAHAQSVDNSVMMEDNDGHSAILNNGGGGGGGDANGNPVVASEYSPHNQITGKLAFPKSAQKIPPNWQAETRVLINYGQYIRFVRYVNLIN